VIFGGGKQNKELDKFGELLVQGVTKLFQTRGEIQFSEKPVVEIKRITDYEGRMRVDGMEKFDNEPTYVSAINYYINGKDMENHKAVGAVITYVKQDYLPKLMKTLKYPPIDDESDDELRDSCGTLCNIIAGGFKTEISSSGYIELEMSHFINFRNSSFGGVEFCKAEYDECEVAFCIDGEKRLVVEMTIGTIPTT